MPSALATLSPLTIDYFSRAVRARLGPTYWEDAEIRLFVVEAIRMWNSAARYYRERVVFQTRPNVAFYDLAAEVPALARTIKDQDLVTEMQYHLLEPPTPTAWTGTEMFTLDQLTAALERRRNQFLGETGTVITHYNPPIAPPPVGRVVLQDSLIDIRRVAWGSIIDPFSLTWDESTQSWNLTGGTWGGSPTWDEETMTWDQDGDTWDAVQSVLQMVNLWRDDEYAINALMQGWSLTPAEPKVYSVSATPPFRMQLAPPPLDTGILDLLVVAAGAALDPTTGVLIGVPDDFAWVVKYGALADLLSKDGPANDPLRAAYCEQRWKDGIELARMSTTAMQAEINGVPAQIVSVFELDSLSANWQNERGAPAVVAMAGLNMVAMSPVPDDAYSVTLDVVRNAPIPATDMVSMNITRDAADAIIDLAEHIGTFKEGGAELKGTMPQYANLMRMASIYNEKLKANAQFFKQLTDRAQVEAQQRPVMETATK